MHKEKNRNKKFINGVQSGKKVMSVENDGIAIFVVNIETNINNSRVRCKKKMNVRIECKEIFNHQEKD